MKFMEDRVGEDFDGLIVSVTKFGMFVELNDMFIEGLVPLASLSDDHYIYHENTGRSSGSVRGRHMHGESHTGAGGPHRPHAEADPICRSRGTA